MSTNNRPGSHLQPESPGALAGAGNRLPDPSVLEAIANQYFGEFTSREEVTPGPGLVSAAPEFFSAIPNLGADTGQYQVGELLAASSPAWPRFAFLEEAREIFTEISLLNGRQLAVADTGLAPSPEGRYQSCYPRLGEGLYPPDKSLRLHLEPVAKYFDVNAVRKDFPILSEKVNGKDLIWLDNSATTQKPQMVIDRLRYFYEHENSNVHRGAHTLAARATDAYEGAREKVARFLNASSSNDIVFVRGTTEAINLVAQGWGKYQLQKDDEILITWLEHHANIVPWQMICAETGAKLRVIPVDDNGQIILDEYGKLLNSKTKIVAATHVSNALGTITPVAEIIQMAHRYGARVLIDGAQAVSHLKVDVQALDCDFYVFSGHKIFAPTGIGVLYAKPEVLHAMEPYQGGGNMIADVSFDKTIYQDPPHRFEAGTGNIADAVGLGAAIDYVQGLGLDHISRYEHNLLAYGMEVLRRIPGLRLIGTAREKTSVLSFVMEGFTTAEIGEALSREGIAVRAGHHCAQPILRRFGTESTVRSSLAFYNTCGEIDALASVLRNLKGGRHIYY